MYPHPVTHLARTHLGGSSRFRAVPGVPAAEFCEAVARFGSGIDHAAGETPIGLLKSTMDGRATARGFSVSYVVTDRRLFGRIEASNTPRLFTDVPYAGVAAMPARPGALAQTVVVHVGYQPHSLYLAPKELHAFFAAMLATIPPAGRTFGPLPPPVRAPQDPTGAGGAVQAIGGMDYRASVALRVLYEAHRRGMVDEQFAASLVPPMVLLARTGAFGRGGGPRGWSSSLPRTVLAQAMRAVLGEPAAAFPSPVGDLMDFSIGAGSGAGAAVASSVVGMAMLATVGVGWISASHGHRLASIRVQIADAPKGSVFQLLGTAAGMWESLSMHWWRAGDVIHQALARVEARYLLGRALFGAGPSPVELWSAPREMVEAQVGGLIGPTNLAMFYPN